MFIMLLAEEMVAKRSFYTEDAPPHHCKPFGPLPEGELNDVTDRAAMEFIPEKLPVFVGREVEESELIRKLQQTEHRIVSVLGIIGVGKSSLIK